MINTVTEIDDMVTLKNVLISVSDKTGLEEFVKGLIQINPGIRIYSTGGTYTAIKGYLGSAADKNLIQVSDYTKQPEMQGGLVKTLDFKIYLGILSETYNDAHKKDIARTNATIFDMIVVNLYPFEKTVAKAESTSENARGNIDIGGPCMLRASAKNFLFSLRTLRPRRVPSALRSGLSLPRRHSAPQQNMTQLSVHILQVLHRLMPPRYIIFTKESGYGRKS